MTDITTPRSNPLFYRSRGGPRSTLSGSTTGDPESPKNGRAKETGQRGEQTGSERVSSKEAGHMEGGEIGRGSSGATEVEIG